MDVLLLYNQYKDLSVRYPGLSLISDDKKTWSIRGTLEFTAEYAEVRLSDEYSIEIMIPEDYPNAHPKVKETGKRIPKYFHQFQGGILCLGALIAVKQKFALEPTLTGFVENCLVPYLYAFSYKEEFGKLPFGELSHGGLGILEFYKDFFKISDNKAILTILRILAENNYRGHQRCPCGSKNRIRACHGEKVLFAKSLQKPPDFQSEYKLILEALIK